MDNQALIQAASLLRETNDTLKSLLEKPFNTVYVGIDARLKIMINQLNFMSGASPESAAPVIHQPVTNFMGEKLEKPKMVKPADLSPEELEKKLFKDKVDNLAANLNTLTNDQVLESYINEPNVIRGVAKIYGKLENYREGEINNQFLDDIRNGRLENEKLLTRTAADNELVKAAKAESESEDLIGK